MVESLGFGVWGLLRGSAVPLALEHRKINMSFLIKGNIGTIVFFILLGFLGKQ